MLNTHTDFVNADFMKKIATDDAFRRQLEQDPASALASVGYSAKGELPSQVMLPATAEAAQATTATESRPPTNLIWAGFIG